MPVMQAGGKNEAAAAIFRKKFFCCSSVSPKPSDASIDKLLAWAKKLVADVDEASPGLGKGLFKTPPAELEVGELVVLLLELPNVKVRDVKEGMIGDALEILGIVGEPLLPGSFLNCRKSLKVDDDDEDFLDLSAPKS